MKWKIVPVEATAEMRDAAESHAVGGESAYTAAIAAAPPYVVTDDDARVVLNAFWDSSITDGVAAMRAALEAFVKRLGGES